MPRKDKNYQNIDATNYSKLSLFIIPPFTDFYYTPARLYPISVITVSKYLKKMGFRVIIADLRFGSIRDDNLPDDLSELKKYYRDDITKFSLFSKYKNYGITYVNWMEDFLEIFIENYGEPMLVLISSLFTAFRKHVYNLVDAVYRRCKNSLIILGGNDIVLDYKAYKNKFDTLYETSRICLYKSLDIDYFKTFLSHKLSKICYIEIEKDTKIVNKNSYNKAKLDKEDNFSNSMADIYINADIFKGKIDYVEKILVYNPYKKNLIWQNPLNLYLCGGILFSSGCPYCCSYCFYSAIKRKSFKIKKDKTVISNLFQLYLEGFKRINIEDDSFTACKQRSVEILEIMNKFNDTIEKNYRDKIIYEFPNGMNYHSLDIDILDKMSRSNISKFTVSMGSLSEKIVSQEKRPSGLTSFDEFLRRYEKYRNKIKVQAFIIAGLKNQSAKEILDSLLYIFKRDLLPGFSLYYPVINSVDYKIFKDELKVDENEKYYLFASSSMIPLKDCISIREKATLFKIYRILSFLKESFIKESTIKNIDLKSILNEKMNEISISFKVLEELYEVFALFEEMKLSRKPMEIEKFSIKMKEKFQTEFAIDFEMGNPEGCSVKDVMFHTSNIFSRNYISVLVFLIFIKTKKIYVVSHNKFQKYNDNKIKEQIKNGIIDRENDETFDLQRKIYRYKFGLFEAEPFILQSFHKSLSDIFNLDIY
ncbi:MAG TPA: hypothetical protein PK520_07760 [Exilispira sp.]|nr:hypothetical protein [Exilispira sp.]